MRLFLLGFILLFCFVFKAQNFVPNGSFESYSTCPASAAFYDITSWCGLSGGEEAFNSCNNSTGNLLGVPYNQFDGFQYPRSGNGMGCVLIHIPGSGQQDKREYLHVPLTANLQSGKTYCGTLYVNLSNEYKYTTDRIGMALTSNSYTCNQAMPLPQTIAPLPIVPQVANTLGNFITDTLNWMEVSNTFTVTGNEAYLTIGNFHDDINTNVVLFNSSASRTVIYFFIDDVSVEEVFPTKAKNDTLIYQGDSTIIGNNTSEAALFSWQPTTGLSCTNCPNPKASPTITTTYTVTKTQCKAVTSDVITVTVSPTGLREMSYELAEMSLIPNPTNGLLTIRTRYDFEKIELTSITGQVLLSETVNAKTHQLQLQNLIEGIYFVKVVYSNGLSTVKKVVVNR